MSKEILKTADASDQAKVLPTPSDEALMVRVCLGDQEALALLFRKYARVVRNIAYRVLRDESEAEDILQEVFLRVHAKCKTFDPSRGVVRSWILQVAFREALCRRRYLNSRHFYINVDLDEVSPCEGQGQEVDRTDAINAVVGKGGLSNAFDALSEDQRQTLSLFFFEGYTLSEIASKLDQPRGRVKHHYVRGLNRLRRELNRNR
jgi:RNA polymerase sigma-70 factor, ECF subfamily